MKEVIRNNERNVSRVDYLKNKKVFYKVSSKNNTNPAEEFYAWECFYAIDSKIIPKCLYVDEEAKSIAFEFLDNYTTISDRYNKNYIKKLVSFLNNNSKKNTIERLKNNQRLMKRSEKVQTEQKKFFIEGRESAAQYYEQKGYIAYNKFISFYDKAFNDFFTNEVLSHCDLGKSNILICGEDLKIVDYEYSMFSVKEVDYARIFSSITIDFYSQRLSFTEFIDMVSILINNDLDLYRFIRLAAFQLIMRLFHTSEKQFNTLLAEFVVKLLSLEDNLQLTTNELMLKISSIVK